MKVTPHVILCVYILTPPCGTMNVAGRNFVRGGLMGLLATFAGMIIFTAPESIAQILKIQLPGILATQPGLLVSQGAQ